MRRALALAALIALTSTAAAHAEHWTKYIDNANGTAWSYDDDYSYKDKATGRLVVSAEVVRRLRDQQIAKGDALVPGPYGVIAHNKIASNKSNTPMGGTQELIVLENATVDLRSAIVMHRSGTEEQLSPGQVALLRLFLASPRNVSGFVIHEESVAEKRAIVPACRGARSGLPLT